MERLIKKDQIINDLQEILESKEIYKDYDLSKISSFKIGGNADIFVEIENVLDLINLLKYVNEKGIKKYIIGRASNLVFPSDGFKGIIIKISISGITILESAEDLNNIDNIKDINKKNIINKIDTNYFVKAGAGVSLQKFCSFLNKNSLGEISNLYGIPGSIGGAVRMNAGAFGTEIKDIIYSVVFLDENLNVKELKAEDLKLSYRNSVFAENDKYIILYATFKLKKVDGNLQEKKCIEIMEKRKRKQPLDFPSAGSVFKRGDGFITAQIIDELGLKGLKVGDAMISKKHAGFIINLGEATSSDVKELVLKIKDEVKERKGYNLETEIIFV